MSTSQLELRRLLKYRHRLEIGCPYLRHILPNTQAPVAPVRCSASSRSGVTRMGWPAQAKVRGAHGAVSATAGSVLVSEPPLPHREAGWLGAGASAPPSKRGSGAASAGVEQESRPRNGLGKKGYFAKHDFHEVPDGVGRVLGPSATTQPAIDEQLQQIEGQRPEK